MTSASYSNKVIATHRRELKADFKNYTNVQPTFLVSNRREGCL